MIDIRDNTTQLYLYQGDPSYIGIFLLYFRMALIFTDFEQYTWLLENLLISVSIAKTHFALIVQG